VTTSRSSTGCASSSSGACLDQRVKQKLLEVAWEDESSDFGYRDSRGGRVLLELAPVPSWHKL
jgi:hypothetical protein